MNVGDKVRIIRTEFGHPDLTPIGGVVGEITMIEPPWQHDPKQRVRYEVCWTEPRGPRGYTGHFPLYDADLEAV